MEKENMKKNLMMSLNKNLLIRHVDSSSFALDNITRDILDLKSNNKFVDLAPCTLDASVYKTCGKWKALQIFSKLKSKKKKLACTRKGKATARSI
jgi:hypothetical protein